MKKEDVTGIIVWALIIALVAVFMLVVVSQYFKNSNMSTGIYILYFAGALLAGLLFNAPLFELAHIVGAKLGRYKVTSVNILGFCFSKENGKTKIKFKTFDGLTGETTIEPVENSAKKPSALLYCINGTIFYAVEIIVTVMLFNILNKIEGDIWAHNWGYFILTAAVVGGVILFYNIMPFKLDMMNDGYRLVLLSKKNKGQEAEDPAKAKSEDKNATQQVIFSKDSKINELYSLLGKEDYKNALDVSFEILETLKDSTDERNYLNIKSQNIYLYIMLNSLESAKEFYDKEVSMEDRRDIAQQTSMTCIRTYILMAGLLDKSQSECLYVIRKVAKAYKRVNSSNKQIEVNLYNKAIDKVQEAHPKWELNQYKINEQ